MRPMTDGQASTGDATRATATGAGLATASTTGGQRAATPAVRQQVPVARVRVSERLARLFEDTRRPDGKRWTINALVDELKARDYEVSRQYLGFLLTGERDNPTLSLLEALADVFKVPVSYFSDDYLGKVTNDLLPLLAVLHDPNVRALLHRPDLHVIAASLADPDESAVEAKLADMIAQVLARQAAGGTPQA